MTNPSIQQLVAEVSHLFQARHSRAPAWIACAPGRVNLIGEHVDYNDGFVLPMAIERHTLVAAAPNGSRRIIVRSSGSFEPCTIDLDIPQVPVRSSWSNYLRGVVAGMLQRSAPLQGLDVVVHSSIPPGGGLSSSAALEVAFATALEASAGIALAPLEKALLCQKAEHEFAGVPCGIMDQFVSVMAGKDCLILIDCRSSTSRLLPFADPAISVLIINSNVRHALGDGEYSRRRSDCLEAARLLGAASFRDVSTDQLRKSGNGLGDRLFRRARHVVTEIQRTVQAAEAAQAAGWDWFGRLMYESHASLRDDYQVSCHELDLLVELAQDIGPAGGVLGSRMTGGGFGGCTVSLVDTGAVEQVASQICDAYKLKSGIEAAAFASKPVGGARLIQI